MKRLASVVAIACGLFAGGCGSRSLPRGGSPSEPASRTSASRSSTGFDFYLLNLSWSPEFCSTHPDAPECASHPGFVLHGLWPERADGSYPEHCSNAPGPTDPSAYADAYPDPGLLRHEWQTHGTCSGLSADAYFSLARAAFHKIAIPGALQNTSAPRSLPPGQIVSLFTASNPGLSPGSVVVSCGNNFLTAVEACLDGQLHPVSCGAVRTCHANSVRIPPQQ